MCNLGQKICRLFHVLAQYPFTTSETELDFYHQKVNIRVTSRVAERLAEKMPERFKDCRKLGNFKKNPEIYGIDGKYPAGHPKDKF